MTFSDLAFQHTHCLSTASLALRWYSVLSLQFLCPCAHAQIQPVFQDQLQCHFLPEAFLTFF